MAPPDRGAIDVTTGAPRVTSLEVGGLRVSTASFPARHRIRSHYHGRACLSVIVEGFFRQRFPGKGYDCPAGAVLVKPPEERHVDRWGDATTLHVIIEPLVVDDRLGPVRPLFEEVGYRLDPAAASLGRRLVRELDRGDDLVPLGAEALASEIVVRTSRRLAEGSADANPPPWLRRVRETLEDRFAEAPLMKDLAADADVHPSRLSREFRRHFGTSPGRYIREVRLARARVDLERGREPLAVVAVRNGFSDQSHLTRELKRATGLTPAAYRRAHHV